MATDQVRKIHGLLYHYSHNNFNLLIYSQNAQVGHPSGRGDWLGSGHSSWRSFISSTKQFGRADLLTLEWFWKQRQSQSGRLASFCHFLPTPRLTSISFHLVGHAVLQMQVSLNSNNFGFFISCRKGTEIARSKIQPRRPRL